jgi:hypothetical protein
MLFGAGCRAKRLIELLLPDDVLIAAKFEGMFSERPWVHSPRRSNFRRATMCCPILSGDVSGKGLAIGAEPCQRQADQLFDGGSDFNAAGRLAIGDVGTAPGDPAAIIDSSA